MDGYAMMRPLFTMLTIALVGLSANGCGGTDKNPSSTPSSVATAPAAAATSTSSIPGGGTSHTGNEPYSQREARLYLNFGHKANDTETHRVTALVTSYYAAASVGDDVKACSLVYSSVAKNAPEDYGESFGPHHLHATSCPAVLSLVFKYRRGGPTADLTAIKVASVHVDDHGVGVAFLRAPGMPSGEIAVQREGNSWKVLQLLGSALPS
jgi:hypothetical protein